MSTVKGAIVSPFTVLGVAVVAFAGWIISDASPTAAPVPTARAATRRILPPPPAADPDAIEARVATIKPGLVRLAVEQQLQTLTAPEVEPIDVTSGRPVFRSRYRINLTRPVAGLAVGSGEFVPGDHILTVEFDGATAGHPLTRVALAPAAGR